MARTVVRRSGIAKRGAKKARYTGTYTVYDSEEEFRRFYPEARLVSWKQERIPPPYTKGDWFQYKDGVIAEVLNYYESTRFSYIITPLNKIHIQVGVFCNASSDYSQTLKTRRVTPLNLATVDDKKMLFLEDWLFRGLTLEEATYNRFKGYIDFYCLRKGDVLAFGYLILSGSWFTRVLENYRVIKDRYMSLINAFDEVGLNDEFLAITIKKALTDGSEKERINALNKVLEVRKAAEDRKPSGVAVNATISIEDERVYSKQLKEAESENREQGKQEQAADTDKVQSQNGEGRDSGNEAEGNASVPPEQASKGNGRQVPYTAGDLTDEMLREALGEHYEEYIEKSRIQRIQGYDSSGQPLAS